MQYLYTHVTRAYIVHEYMVKHRYAVYIEQVIISI